MLFQVFNWLPSVAQVTGLVFGIFDWFDWFGWFGWFGVFGVFGVYVLFAMFAFEVRYITQLVRVLTGSSGSHSREYTIDMTLKNALIRIL